MSARLTSLLSLATGVLLLLATLAGARWLVLTALVLLATWTGVALACLRGTED